MPLIPRTPKDWTHSFAVPLFVACLVIIFILVMGGYSGTREWRYWGKPVACVLLPSLGMALGLTCLFGTGLNKASG